MPSYHLFSEIVVGNFEILVTAWLVTKDGVISDTDSVFVTSDSSTVVGTKQWTSALNVNFVTTWVWHDMSIGCRAEVNHLCRSKSIPKLVGNVCRSYRVEVHACRTAFARHQLHFGSEIVIYCENIPRKIIFLIMKSSYRPTVGTLFLTKSLTKEFSKSESIEINLAPLVSQIE